MENNLQGVFFKYYTGNNYNSNCEFTVFFLIHSEKTNTSAKIIVAYYEVIKMKLRYIYQV